jgi:hypothetical protein
MSKAITEICSGYSVQQLERIVDFLERAAEAGSRVSSEMKTPDTKQA